MRMIKTLRTAVAGALVVAMPVSVASAATRPASAVPTAASTTPQISRDYCTVPHPERDALCLGCDLARPDREIGCTRAPSTFAHPPAYAFPALVVVAAAFATAIMIEDHTNNGSGSGFSR